MRAAGRSGGPVRRCADGSCRPDPRLKLRRSYRKKSIMARCWSALACRRGGVGRGKCVHLFLVSTTDRELRVCQGQLGSLASCGPMADMASRTGDSAGRSGGAVLTWCSTDRQLHGQIARFRPKEMVLLTPSIAEFVALARLSRSVAAQNVR